jgi:hypothetical protein
MSKKLYDCIVCTGRYTDANGQEKARWQNVGAVIETKNGLALLLERWFNPAGVVDDKGGDNVLINLMPPKDRASGSDAPF